MASLGKLLEKIVDWFAALAVVVMTLLVFFQVANRYMIGWIVPWTEEVSRILFIWITFVGAYLALKSKSHIAVSTLFDRFTPANKEKISNTLMFLVFYFIGYLFWLSLKVIPATVGTTTPVLEISYLYIHLSFPIFMGLMLIHLCGRIFHMGWRRLAFSCLASMVLLAAVYLIFGIKPFSGPVLVVVSLACTGILIAFSMPIVFALGIGCAIFLVLFKDYPHQIMHTRMVGGIDSFPLLAVPFFILAGELLNIGGVTARLVALAKVFVGSIRGGLGMVTVLGEYFFSGISGSTVADVSAIGSIMVPALKKAGYKPEETVSIVSAASAMGMLVPPSIPAVVLGGITGMSVGALFVGGFLPAIVIALCIMALIYIQAVRSKIPLEKRLPFKEAMKAVAGAIIPLLCPVIIFAGILTGVATPTEIAVVAVLYAFIVGVFVYKEIKWSQIVPILRGTAVTTGSVMLLVGVASALSWILSTNQVPNIVGTAITGISDSPLIFLLLCNLCFIILGAVLEGVPAMLILVPIFLPFVDKMGINQIHFGILVIACLGIGIFLPPIGMGMFIACNFAQIDVGKMFRSFTPYLFVFLVGLFIITYFPWFTTVLVDVFFPTK
ncbi:MAG: TRAP transporter large permease subunit [Deltaproteobacteria bacterium]|nr:TRAP transporter large permease subunit [Deltaproteobacteria bacterium]